MYYLPSLVTRGMPVDAIRWATMSGATKDSACSTLLGWVILPEGLCASSNRIASSAIAETVLTVQCAKVSGLFLLSFNGSHPAVGAYDSWIRRDILSWKRTAASALCARTAPMRQASTSLAAHPAERVAFPTP